ncbi:hypothetical protein A2311_03040 [candidate division WOR-1 bacterium RIFOXYB2_FULL_48_7]|uniref:Phosphomannomutase n=1 Tax=candidate division WOR-1 bacterium RIFOXYB2_FULL_48_7 TaxID=1802583 RepID=A0A1F4TV01_UNCSA|nr:MAG: hypothetical protein A2311_03040 [candidate division WOR-1 bacterium RIFOXYB2_FULL_48_7]
MTAIKFGTDGWRGIIAQDFTFDNLRLVSQAFVSWLKSQQLADKGLFIGYDNRFDSENFAQAAAEVCSGAGIKTFLSPRAVPTPVVSFAVNKLKLGAGIMITASHNPPQWNGFKIKENFGGSAFPETTQAVEKALTEKLLITPTRKNIELLDPIEPYLKFIGSKVDLQLIKSPNIKIVVDAMYGSGAGLFARLGLPVMECRGFRDTQFGGINPEPIPVNLDESISFTKEVALKYRNELTGCIILDGDADRLAAIDGTGQFINTHNVFCLLLKHLFVHRKMKGEVVKTFNLTNLIDTLCRQYGLKLTVTPIGFKHIAKIMLERDVLLGGEESGGMGIKGNIPERDGILAGLHLLELMAYEKKTFKQILDALMDENGYFFYSRIDKHTEKAQALVKNLSQQPPQDFAGQAVSKVETLDGLKFNFADGSWILFRASGTEPLLRIYCEGTSQDRLEQLLAAGDKLAS